LVVMTQRVDRNSMVRQVQVMKMRGNAPQPGLHTIRISNDGVSAFPRMLKPIEEVQATITRELISTGIPGLDEMLGGGTLRCNAVLIAGPVGSGKTTTAVQFIAERVKHQEPGMVVIFENTAQKYLVQSKELWINPWPTMRCALRRIRSRSSRTTSSCNATSKSTANSAPSSRLSRHARAHIAATCVRTT